MAKLAAWQREGNGWAPYILEKTREAILRATRLRGASNKATLTAGALWKTVGERRIAKRGV